MDFALSLRDTIMKTVLPIRGIKPTFSEYHVLKTLLILYEKGPLGRQLLSKHLGLSVTSVRTLIKRLKMLNLVDVDPVAGCILTKYGQALVNKLTELIVLGGDVTKILEKNLLLYDKAYSFLLRNGVKLLEQFNISYLRDVVIKHKAKATIIVYVSNSKAYIPPYIEFNEDLFPSLRKIRILLKARNLDVIMVIFAEDEKIAEEAFFMSLLELGIL